jgi:ribonuclease HI
MTDATRKAVVFISSSARSGMGWWAIEVRPESKAPLRRKRQCLGATQNQACLNALCDVLEGVREGAALTIVCDADYLTLGISRDLTTWRANGWKKSGGGSIANIDLWKRVDAGLARHKVEARRSNCASERAALDALRRHSQQAAA